MFTPSLMTMMLHSAWIDLPGLRTSNSHKSIQDIAQDIFSITLDSHELQGVTPKVPVTGYSNQPGELDAAAIPPYTVFNSVIPPSLFGRIPVDLLANHLLQNYRIDSQAEYLDLGTPLIEANTSGNLSCVDMSACKQFFGIRSNQPPSIRVALIDRGVKSIGRSPDNFNGRIHHLTTDVEFSYHAASVFETLLGRLKHHNLIDEVEFIVGLVCEPTGRPTLSPFKSANIVELQETLNKLAKYLEHKKKVPLVTNISMGSQVGPHTGTTPLEINMADIFPFGEQCIFTCSAGNGGMSGVSAQVNLTANVRDTLRLMTSSDGCQELLVEVWWEELGTPTLEATVTMYSTTTGSRKMVPLHVNPRVSGATAKDKPTWSKGVVCQSLYHNKCLDHMHCLAFGLSAQADNDLAGLTIDIDLTAGRNVHLRSWIVFPGPRDCWFIGSVPAESVMIPSTMHDAISVAAMEGSQPWKYSSRGDPNRPGKPTISHIAENWMGTQKGTSFASPRIAADIVERYMRAFSSPYTPYKIAKFDKVNDLVNAVLARHGTSHNWNIRTGYGSVTTGP